MEVVKVKNVILGDGIPKICVPIVGRTTEDVLEKAKMIEEEAQRLEKEYADQGTRVSMVEFRADYYNDVTNRVVLLEMLGRLREILKNRVILFTYRSEEEGGELRHDRAENMVDDIYDWVMTSGLIDMIDVELLSGNYRVARLTTKAHDNGVKVVISNHDFEKTPRTTYIEDMLRSMDILGGDVLKVVSTPQTELDVKRVLEICESVTKGRNENVTVSHPVVMISMGQMGKISRTSGKITGSAFTFASVEKGQESAPGQCTLDEIFTAVNE